MTSHVKIHIFQLVLILFFTFGLRHSSSAITNQQIVNEGSSKQLTIHKQNKEWYIVLFRDSTKIPSKLFARILSLLASTVGIIGVSVLLILAGFVLTLIPLVFFEILGFILIGIGSILILWMMVHIIRGIVKSRKRAKTQ